MEYEIRERRYTDHLVHYVVVERIKKIDTGIAHASREVAYDHLLTTLTGTEREILDHTTDVKDLLDQLKTHPDYKTVDGQRRYNTLSGQYQAYVHTFTIITGQNAYYAHALVEAIRRDRGMKTKSEGVTYTAYLHINKNDDDEITIVNKHGEMINDFPVMGTKIDALEANGWELVTRVWKNVSDEDSPYGKYKITVRRA